MDRSQFARLAYPPRRHPRRRAGWAIPLCLLSIALGGAVYVDAARMTYEEALHVIATSKDPERLRHAMGVVLRKSELAASLIQRIADDAHGTPVGDDACEILRRIERALKR